MREMKDSGIEWIGEIPANWKYIKLKTYYAFEKGKNAQLYTEKYIGEHEGIYPVYSGQTENNGVMGRINTYNYSLDECLFSTTVGAKVMTPKILSGKFSLSQNCLIMKQIKECDNHYFYYYLFPLFDYEKKSIPSYMQPSLRVEDLKRFGFYIPDVEEQKRIADLLDAKCNEIDALTEDIQTQIETLEQYKKFVITEAVTKGLNHDVEMKDSGIEWIGKIPSHWNIIKGKYLLKYLQKPIRPTDEVITCFRDGEVTLRSNRREDGFTMSDKEIGYQGIDIGDLVVHGMDGFAGAIGISDSRGKASPVLNVLDTVHNKKYIMYYLRSMAYSNVFLALATGIRVRSCDLRWNKLANLPYLIPPIEEQYQISNYIDIKLSKVEEVIKEKKQQLEILLEYKNSLIYEYVTGKKEVVEW